MTRSRLAGLTLAVTMAVLVSACSSHQYDLKPLPKPKRVQGVEATPTTVFEELGAVALPRARGTTTTSLPLGPGPMTIRGRVDGPDGPVPDAVIHLERLVGDAVVATDVPSGADGNWNLEHVLGGRWRIRAFKAPALAQDGATVLFLTGDTPPPVVLQVQAHTGVTVTRSIAPDPPVVGAPANLAARVTTVEVDETGVVRSTPVVGTAVTLVGSSASWSADTTTGTTDGDGQVAFRVVCHQAGKQSLGLADSQGTTHDLDLPACVVPAPATTTTTTVPGASSTTTTTRPGSTTTTTTRPR